MTLFLDNPQWQMLERAWRNFNTVVGQLPSSDTTTLLSFHARNLLDKLAHPPVNRLSDRPCQ
jgi:predicted component of type VI protein secretion system